MNLSLNNSPYNVDVSYDDSPGCNFGHKLQNVDKFREEALKFQEYGYYTNHPFNRHKDSPYGRYWAEQRRRSIDGYHIGSDWIPGYYYFYLNFSPIMRVEYDESELVKVREGKQIKGKRIFSHPDIWDYDYYYFHYLEEAEKAGKHGSVLKCRRRGYSFKGGSMLRRNFHLIPNSKSFALASQETFLIKDGILNKSNDIGNFINEYTGFRRLSQKHNQLMHTRASYFRGGVEQGIMSEIIGKTLNNNADRARGISGKLILFEEAGEFPELLKAWQIAKESVQQDNITYGLMVAFGTGGSKMTSYQTLNELFFKPEAYDIHGIKNIWSSKARVAKSGFFAPVYANVYGFMDKNGNTDVLSSYEHEFVSIEKMEAMGTDPSAIMQRRSERPLRPEDALLRADTNDFPIKRIENRLADLQGNEELISYSRVGNMKIKNKEVIFDYDKNASVIKYYPHAKTGSNEGAVEMWEVPTKLNGVVPEDLYIMGVDGYDQNSSSTMSLGSCFVMNRLTGLLVAEYTGRPTTADDFNEQVLLLALYFNAKVNFENNLLGIRNYFKSKGYEHILIPAPEIIKKISKVAAERELGTPGTTQINKYARERIKAWLLESVVKGDMLDFVDTINSVPLLQELSGWNIEDNFDRVSSLGMLMIFYESTKGVQGLELNKDLEVYDPAADPFWSRTLQVNNTKFNIDDFIMKL